MRWGSLFIALLVGVVIGFFQYKKEKQPAARKVTPPTLQEAEVVGKEFAKSLAPCDAAAVDRVLDLDMILARTVANRRIGSEDLKGMKRGLGDLGQRLCQELSDPKLEAKYLRTQMIDGAPQPLIRLTFDEGVNYYQLELDKRSDNTIRVADLYLYLTGEKMSDTFGTALDMLMQGPEGPAMAAIDTIKRVKQHQRAGEFAEARAELDKLPAAMRKRKPVMLMEVLITSELGDELYTAAMDAYAKAFPNDASLALVQIDRLVLGKKYDEELATVDKLDKQLGGDPYLEMLRVDAYLGLGKPAEAVAAAKRGTEAEPTLEPLWWTLLAAQATAGTFDDAVPTMDTLATKFGAHLTPDALALDERFTKLADSAAYKTWAKKATPAATP